MENFLFILWFIIVILCLIVEFNPKAKEHVTNLFIIE